MILALLLAGLAVVTFIVLDVARREKFWPVALGLSCFITLSVLNLQWPDFAPMGERLRDYAILSSVMHDPIFPEEPWFVGYPLNYYLNWYRLAAIPGLIGFAPWEIYHLLGPATMGLGIASTAILLVSFGRLAPLVASLISISVWLGSNVSGLFYVWRHDHNWWGPSRVISGAINEFPAWSWILGDLHPHYLNLCALPFMLVLSRKLHGWNFVCALIALCAWNYSANAWDTAPALLLMLTLMLADWRSLLRGGISWRVVSFLLVLTVLLIGSAWHINAPDAPLRFVDWRVSFQPYIETVASHIPLLKLQPHTPGVFGSNLLEFLLHWGLPVFILTVGALLRIETVRDAFAIGLAFIMTMYSQSVFVLILSSIFLLGYFRAWKLSRQDGLLIAMLLIILVPEIVFFDDPYGGENERMNTIFKFYSFAWVVFSMTAWIWMLERVNYKVSVVSVTMISVLTLAWTVQTIGDRRQRNFIVTPKAQGLSHFESAYPGSGKAIQQLVRLPRGTVIEAENGAYSDGAFVSTLSSKPSFLGWANHVGLLLQNPPELSRRQEVIKEFYNADCETKASIMRRENITYAVFGSIERRAFPSVTAESIACLEQVIKEESIVVASVH